MEPEEIEKEWPAIEAQLESGDVLMIRHRHSWSKQNIQRMVGGYWNHTALVFMPKKDLPVGGPLIVEADLNGVEIHQMKRYSDRFDLHDIGVLRCPSLTPEQKDEIVMGFILSNLDASYNYRRLLAFPLLPFFRKASKKLFSRFLRTTIDTNEFICTTFVHKAFREVTARASGGPAHDSKINEPIRIEKEELITPSDIAKEPIFEWVFNAHD